MFEIFEEADRTAAGDQLGAALFKISQRLGLLPKTAEISDDRARRSLDRIGTLEQNKPTVGQAARYGAIGGLGGGVIGAVGHLVERGALTKGETPKAKALNLAANVAKGALGGGAIPLLRNSMDRRAEMGTLNKYVQERAIPNA